MKAGKASTVPLPIDFKKLRAFSKFSKVSFINKTAKNIISCFHRLTNSIKANSRTWFVIQTD